MYSRLIIEVANDISSLTWKSSTLVFYTRKPFPDNIFCVKACRLCGEQDDESFLVFGFR